MPSSKPTIHEVDFCSQIASEANILIRQNPSAYPFLRGPRRRLTGRERADGNVKTCDSTAPTASCFLCGEVKLPGTPEGRSPLADKLMQDAEAKAGNATRRCVTSSPGTSTSS